MVKPHFRTNPERVNRHGQRQRGVTAIEYALIATLIAIVALVSMAATGGANAFSWSTTADKISTAIQTALGL
ncbi:Flp family type IVb pilin [Polaromonas sp.]|uniref:Flp family type IVb pilin n=1 Tax=Polaromonas sp. TaxID=1869339 RepID=UPI002FC7F3D9